MKLINQLIIVFCICTFLNAKQKFTLSDGSVIQGEIASETETEFIVKTQFGEITILKSNILTKLYKVELNSGDSIIGEKIFEDDGLIKLKTSYGEIELYKSDIKSISEKGEAQEEVQKQLYNPQRPFGLAGLLFSGKTFDKNSDFSLGEEQLIDLFFDPTAYTLKQGTLYLSGLSFGFGLTDKLQISSKWSGFFYRNFNIRPKFKILDVGNWERQKSLSVGAHLHTNWMSNKYVWKTGTVDVSDEKKWWGGFYHYDDEPEYEYVQGNNGDEWDNDRIERIDNDIHNGDETRLMLELFTAYTYSKAKEGLKGRVSHTIGANIQFPDEWDTFYRIYYGIDVDVNRKLKMIGEVFYDPFYSSDWDDGYHNDFELSDLTKSKVNQDFLNTIHFDFGFMYALNESFRFGIHFQPYIFAFYWKF
jgi:hypothetical protein